MIAIDFGTTNSSIALFSDSDTEPRLQMLEYSDNDSYDPHLLPSVVGRCESYHCETKRTFGHAALRHGLELGHDTELLQEMKLHFDPVTMKPPTLVETKSFDKLREEQGALSPIMTIQRVPVYEADVPLLPAHFVPGTADLIRQLISRINTEDKDRQEIVMGIPASFRGKGARFLREAANLGVFGKNNNNYAKIFLYPEPLAAARSYSQVRKGCVLVLDYGGGTLDITVMRLGDSGKFERDKIHFDGFPEGGTAMDRRLLGYCLSKSDGKIAEWFEKQPLAAKARIKRSVEKAKIRLSTHGNATVELPNSEFDPIPLDIQDMSFALQPIMTRMTSKVTSVIGDAKLRMEDIDFVVMSGGSSLNAAVQSTVFAMFQHLEKEQFIIPDAKDQNSVETCLCAVARGLALLRRDGFASLDVNTLP